MFLVNVRIRNKCYLLFIFFLITLCLHSSIMGQEKKLEDLYVNHIIRSDRDGIAINPKINSDEKRMKETDFRAYVKNILDKAEKCGEGKKRNKDGKARVKILIHVHGGRDRR